MDLCPSQRETSEIGTPSASAVLANVCRRSWNVVSSASPAAVMAGFQISLFVVITSEQGSPRSATQHIAITECELLDMLSYSVEDEPRHGHVPERCRSLGTCKDGTAVNDDDLLVNGDHSCRRIDAVKGQAERLALPEAQASAHEYKQRVPSWHHAGQREHLAGGKQTHNGGTGFRQPDFYARRLANVSIPDGSAHDAGVALGIRR